MFKDLLSKILSDKKQTTILLGIIVLLVIGLTNIYISKTTPPTTAEKAPTATLSLEPKQKIVKSGEIFEVAIILDTKNEKADAVDAILTYDPSALEVIELKSGITFSTYPIKSHSSGKIQLSGFTLPEGKTAEPFFGRGILGTITFKSINSGSSEIIFDENCIIAYQGENRLGKTSGGTYTVE